jgi:hypothetical protein
LVFELLASGVFSGMDTTFYVVALVQGTASAFITAVSGDIVDGSNIIKGPTT